MAEIKSQFFNGNTYSAVDFVESNKNTMKDGILPNTDFFKVLPASNMTIGVTSGRGWIQGHAFSSDNTLSFTLDNADGVLGRIDTVVIRLDLTTGAEKCECKVIKGSLGGGATAPVRNGTYYDLVIAYINVAHGTTTITSAMITDKRPDNTLCGWSGAINAQQLQFDTKADKADVGDKTTLTTTAKDNLVGAINECKTGVANANAISLLGEYISTTVPSAGQVLQFDGTNYIPTTCGYVSGMYTGDGTELRTIILGFKPKALILYAVDYNNTIMNMSSYGSSQVKAYGTVIGNGEDMSYYNSPDLKYVGLVSNGFTVGFKTATVSNITMYNCTNGIGSGSTITYKYIAFR